MFWRLSLESAVLDRLLVSGHSQMQLDINHSMHLLAKLYRSYDLTNGFEASN